MKNYTIDKTTPFSQSSGTKIVVTKMRNIKDYQEPKTIGGLSRSKKIQRLSGGDTITEFNILLSNVRWHERLILRASIQRETRINKRNKNR